VAGTVLLPAAGTGLLLLSADHRISQAVIAAVAVAAPTLAVAGPLWRSTALVRAVLAVGAVVSVNTLVAQVMITAAAWSNVGGAVAVTWLSALLGGLLLWLVARDRGASDASRTETADAGSPAGAR
jgi:hypothetical protein